MKKKTTYLLYILIINLIIPLQFTGQITELFFSEYAEGSSNNKYLEIYNGTNSSISLDNYAFPNVSNAPTTPGQYEYWNTFPAGATIASGDVYVIAHPSADPAILAHADHTFSYLSNGDDGFALVSGGTHNDTDGDGNIDAGEMVGFALLDHIGNWAGDPGTGWDVAGVANATQNHTLVRKSSVTGPNPCWDQTCGNSSAGTNATDSEWIVYPINTWTYLGSHSISSPLVGTWKLSPNAGALGVGPNQGDIGWWSNSAGDVTGRACLFDDSISFDANGNFIHYMDGSTWVENWQDGGGDRCATPVSPHAGGSFTYTYTGTQLTVTGSGAHIGLPKATNQGELSAGNPPALPSSRTYEISFGANGEMIADINFGGGWWRAVYVLAGNPPPPSYNITLTVNTANITVGPNGMYAGGGFLGGSDALQMTDADGDGTWEAVTTINAGPGSNYYAFFNSPSHGSDWGTKENLAGLPCGISSNFNDRVLPTITSDTTIQHCFGNCAFDGTCNPPPLTTYNVTFSVNTANITVGPNGMYAGGGVLGNAMAVPLSDPDGDGTWSGVASIADGITGNYIFLNSPSHGGDWGTKEDLTGLPCADPNNWNDRILPVITSDTTLLHCFGNCVTDGTCGVDPCLQIAPYLEDFAAGLPTCWDENQTTGSGWVFSGNPGYTAGSNGRPSGTYAWIDFSGSDVGAVLNAPPVDISALTTPELSFDYFSDQGTFTVTPANILYIEADNGSAWVIIDSIQDATTPGWNAYTYDITGYDVSGIVSLRFRAESGGAGNDFYNDILLDDFNVRETPSCTDPTGLTVGTVTSDSVSLSWTPGGSETQWFVYLVDASGSLSTTTPTTVNSSSVTLAVNPSTAYTAYVQAFCGAGDSSAVVGPTTFSTQVAPGTCGIFTVDLVDSYGDGWNGNGLVVSINGSITDTLTLFTGSAGSFQIAVNIGDVLDFDWVLDAYATGGNTWPGENSYNVYDVTNTLVGSGTFDAAAGEVNDVMGVTACPACSAPSGIMASNITTNSADVSWTAGGTETEWWFVLDGVGQSVTSTTNALTGLTPATIYTVEIAAICGAGDTSSLSLPYTFATACGVASAPYAETFDAASLSPCWTQDTADIFDWSVDANGTPSPGTGPSDDITGGGNYMYTEASVPRAYLDSAILISQDIDVSALSFPELNFFSHMYGSAIGTLRVDMHDGSGYTTVFTKSGDQGNAWVEESILLSTTASTVNFKIVAVLDSNAGGQSWPGDIAIDHFRVIEASANDLAIVAAIAPTGCELTSTEPIEVWVVNQGLVAESNFTVSYGVNGGAVTTETVAGPLAVGDTLMYVFTATADMSTDGATYDVALNVNVANDGDTTNNNYSVSGENLYTPGAPSATGDTICDGDTATVMAMSADGPITWYDAMTGGNVVGSGDNLSVAPTATTSYYAEAKAAVGYSDDFESYNVGDFIAQSNTTNWATWPGGTLGGLYDAPVSNAQAASGSNSLHLDNSASNVPDPVLPFGGQTWTSGSFEFTTNLYVETTAYFNLQGSANIGTVWAMEMTFTGAGGLTDPFTYNLGGGALTGTYPGTGVWFNVTLKCADLTTGTWELFIDGVSKGTATLPNGTAVGGCNLYAAAGNNYYVDDIGWSAVAADACTGARTEAVVTVVDCSNITELTKGNMEVYPNPNNGEFVITTSNEVMNVTITDVRGKVVYSNNSVNNHTINVNLSDLERGMYMINVETANGTMTENVIVQ